MSTTVVIPTINQRESLTALVTELTKQGQTNEIVVFDNGHYPPIHFGSLATTISAHSMTIHEMWNKGWNLAQTDYVCFLNDDIAIGGGFIAGLERVLDENSDAALVCPNYDNRLMVGPESTRDICAGRYDGTGGIAGFAFMVRRDMAYRFPDWLEWFCGDSHLLYTVLSHGQLAVISPYATCEHLNGGSNSKNWGDDPIVHRDIEFYGTWEDMQNAPRSD